MALKVNDFDITAPNSAFVVYILRDCFGFCLVKDFLTDNQIDVILGPYDDATGIVADKLRVPYICTTGSKRNLNYTFQILPPLEDFSQAIFDMTKSYQWDKVSLFYDDLRGKFLFKK